MESNSTEKALYWFPVLELPLCFKVEAKQTDIWSELVYDIREVWYLDQGLITRAEHGSNAGEPGFLVGKPPPGGVNLSNLLSGLFGWELVLKFNQLRNLEHRKQMVLYTGAGTVSFRRLAVDLDGVVEALRNNDKETFIKVASSYFSDPVDRDSLVAPKTKHEPADNLKGVLGLRHLYSKVKSFFIES